MKSQEKENLFFYYRNNQKNTRERKENWMSEPISRPISWKEFPEYPNGNFVLKCKKRMEAVYSMYYVGSAQTSTTIEFVGDKVSLMLLFS